MPEMNAPQDPNLHPPLPPEGSAGTEHDVPPPLPFPDGDTPAPSDLPAVPASVPPSLPVPSTALPPPADLSPVQVASAPPPPPFPMPPSWVPPTTKGGTAPPHSPTSDSLGGPNASERSSAGLVHLLWLLNYFFCPAGLVAVAVMYHQNQLRSPFIAQHARASLYWAANYAIFYLAMIPLILLAMLAAPFTCGLSMVVWLLPAVYMIADIVLHLRAYGAASRGEPCHFPEWVKWSFLD